MTTYTEHLIHAPLNLLALQTALIDKGVLSDSHLAHAVEKITREGKDLQDDLAANPEKVKAMLQGKKAGVQ